MSQQSSFIEFICQSRVRRHARTGQEIELRDGPNYTHTLGHSS